MVIRELQRTLLTQDAQLPVAVLKDVKITMHGGPGELVLKKGAKLELPLSDALPLLKKGFIALDSERLHSPQEVNKVRWLESRDAGSIQALNGDFYLKARLSIIDMEQRGVDERKVSLVKATLVDIIRLRLQKIMKAVSASPEPSRDLLEKLTWEERMLYTTLCGFVREWYRSMVEFIEKGDVIG
ncbi:MAG: hypothetical protein QXY49_03975 [Thermofilaceae archaeon]